MKCASIYADFVAQCERFALPGPWSRFSTGDESRRVPMIVDGIMDTLLKKYELDQLIGSGVVVQTGKGPDINSLFLGMPNPIIPMRSYPQAKPFDLVTCQGTARGRWPLSTAVKDFQTKNAIATSGFLFATFDHQDFACLRTLGIPVTPACGLDKFTPDKLAAFRGAFGFGETKPPAIPHHLILVAWSPHRLLRQRGTIVDRTARALVRNRSCLGLPLQNILLWQPSFSEVEGIATCLRLGEAPDAVAAIAASVAENSSPIAQESTKPNAASVLLKTEKRLHAALMDPAASSSRRERLLRKHHTAVNKSLVAPILKLAEKATDQSERIRLRELARLRGTLETATLWQSARIEKEIVDHGLRGDQKVFDLRNIAKGVEALLKLTKEEE